MLCRYLIIIYYKLALSFKFKINFVLIKVWRLHDYVLFIYFNSFFLFVNICRFNIIVTTYNNRDWFEPYK